MRGIGAAVLVLLVGVAAGCAPVGGAPGSGPSLAAAGAGVEDAVQVQVRNETTSTLRIFVESGGDEMPMGRVEALGERAIRIPYGMGGTIRLVARPGVGMPTEARHRSEPIQVMRGQRIEWQLRLSPGVSDVPRISTVRVFACGSQRC
jgi:hypothetical protein